MKTIYLMAMMILCTSVSAQNKNFIDQPFLEVAGTADTLVVPNEIFIRIMLSERDSRDRITVQELEQKMVTVLKALGTDVEKDLAVSDINSVYKYYLLKNKDIIKSKVYTLKVTDATTATLVFIKLEEVGISGTSIEKVTHTDLDELHNKMRSRAITDARRRALALVRPLQQSIGVAIHIADQDGLQQQLQGRVMGIQIRGISSLSYAAEEVPKIEFEKIKVAASVQVKFVLKEAL